MKGARGPKSTTKSLELLPELQRQLAEQPNPSGPVS